MGSSKSERSANVLYPSLLRSRAVAGVCLALIAILLIPAERAVGLEVHYADHQDESDEVNAQLFGTSEKGDEQAEGLGVAAYASRAIEPDLKNRDTAPIVSFPVPTDCEPHPSRDNVLRCDRGEVLLTPVVLRHDGPEAPFQLAVSDREIRITEFMTGSSDVGATIALFAARADRSDELKVAHETFVWMMKSPDSAELRGDRSAGGESSVQATPAAVAAAKRPAKVGIPRTYKYCRKHKSKACQPKERHDYCSYSPDRLRLGGVSVDFRGPCARHDMGIDVIAKKKISLAKKRNQRTGVDQVFRSHLRQNCQHYLHGNRPATTTCFGAASVYYGFVSGASKRWDGK